VVKRANITMGDRVCQRKRENSRSEIQSAQDLLE
jgi:hypothetical protein